MSAQPLMIIGDFNIHVDDSNDVYAVEFLDILASMAYGSYATCGCYTLDLVITRQFDSIKTIILHPLNHSFLIMLSFIVL